MSFNKNIFGDRLREVMERNGLTGRELSKKTSVTESSISRYLSHQMIPRLDCLFELSEVLNVNPQWLIGLDDVHDKPFLFCPYCGERLK